MMVPLFGFRIRKGSGGWRVFRIQSGEYLGHALEPPGAPCRVPQECLEMIRSRWRQGVRAGFAQFVDQKIDDACEGRFSVRHGATFTYQRISGADTTPSTPKKKST